MQETETLPPRVCTFPKSNGETTGVLYVGGVVYGFTGSKIKPKAALKKDRIRKHIHSSLSSTPVSMPGS